MYDSNPNVNTVITAPKGVPKFDLKVGQWIKFSTDKDITKFSEEKRKIYQDDQYYLVVRGTRLPASYVLMDKDMKIHDYNPNIEMLDLVTLAGNQKIYTISNDELESKYGKEKMLEVYEAAKSSWNMDGADTEIQIFKRQLDEKAYTLGATVGAFDKKLDPTSSMHIGYFLWRKEGGRLAQTSTYAAQLAREEQEKKEGIKKTF